MYIKREKAGQSQDNVPRGTTVLNVISIYTEGEGRPVPGHHAQRDNGSKLLVYIQREKAGQAKDNVSKGTSVLINIIIIYIYTGEMTV